MSSQQVSDSFYSSQLITDAHDIMSLIFRVPELIIFAASHLSFSLNEVTDVDRALNLRRSALTTTETT